MKHGLLSLSSGSCHRSASQLLTQGSKAKVINRIMTRDASVYSSQAKLKALVANRLGWVDVASGMQKKIAEIEKFGNQALKDGIRHVVLIGMGGSSLCPELFGLVFGKHSKIRSYHVLDSTDPVAVASVDRKIELGKTLFIVASKSGGTIETRSHEAYFWHRLQQELVKNPGKHFAAITDKGSDLEKSSKKNKYRHVFVNPSDIGGRYSALSFFGLVPAFFAGCDLKKLLTNAVAMEELLRTRTDETNPGLALGTLMAAAWKAGRDKLTFVASAKSAPLVPWIEQLVAESTGKHKKGIVPIEHEPLLPVGKYGQDRVFVFCRFDKESNKQKGFAAKLQKMNVPVVEMVLDSSYDLGGQFLLWEAATAVAGWHMKINPFDEPNVTESKQNTMAILAAFEKIGSMPIGTPHAIHGNLSLLLDDKSRRTRKNGSLKSAVHKLLGQGKAPRYVALLNYFASDAQSEIELDKIRALIGGKTGVATLRGYGPRFLHSIGQLYKGGAPKGVFVVFVRNQYARLGIPGKVFDFGQLITAQAIGDTQALVSRKLPVLLIGLDGVPSKALREFQSIVRSAR
ncbi:MAG: glucose-6-phosphate isomerase [Candidatus Zixiibacteriota bacterium]